VESGKKKTDNLFDFLLLHEVHAATKFSMSSVPPLDTGRMWSTVLAIWPQYAHIYPSRLKTRPRMRFHVVEFIDRWLL
jgi:hypothetical protein